MRRSVKRVLAPVERFLAIEAASGILLMITAAVALLWANSPWRTSYADLWHIPIGFSVGDYAFQRDLHFWINDGLMTIFFFVVGLEIRRELHGGELSELRRAALPVAAAVGGMLVPASIYYFLNAGRASASGWAVPMATDIAFAVGALALLANRVPPALRVLLLALAVIDDVGAIIVIALFYSATLNGLGFVVFGLGIVCILLLHVLGIRSALAYVAPAVVIWTGAYIAGVHPTLAGVVVGLLTPAIAWYDTAGFLHKIETGIRSLRNHDVSGDRELIPHLDALKAANREAVSPVERLQHQLHGWVAFGIMPLFALANAGVPIGQISFDGDALWVFCGVVIGLMFGKPIGILAVSWIAVRLRVAALPTGVGWSHIAVVGMVGGIGFTMALFIAQLAFPAGPLLETAKIAILCGSALAGVLALLFGRQALQVLQTSGAALNEADAESSTIH
ncbi:MAG TPA: Na+/H+ antiporter NhaA [Terriglobia bacterium]|nr:Na+/H+ antiporter NhaA [Terriglobia bacterium]